MGMDALCMAEMARRGEHCLASRLARSCALQTIEWSLIYKLRGELLQIVIVLLFVNRERVRTRASLAADVYAASRWLSIYIFLQTLRIIWLLITSKLLMQYVYFTSQYHTVHFLFRMRNKSDCFVSLILVSNRITTHVFLGKNKQIYIDQSD